jgi:hypothetical protein
MIAAGLTVGMYRIKLTQCGAVAELADAEDLKSSGGDTLWVQVPPAPYTGLNYQVGFFRPVSMALHPVRKANGTSKKLK